MGNITEVTGIVVSAMPVGENDRRVVLITKELGKISVFAKGARRMNSPLTGVTRPFVFGKFVLYEGRTSYTIRQADISNYFEEIISNLDNVCFACYFAEIAEYYSRENLDGGQIINLLYISLRALINKNIPNTLIRYIYEIKSIEMNGECPDFFKCVSCQEEEKLVGFTSMGPGLYCESCKKLINDGYELSPSSIYTLQYIVTAPLEKLYTFKVNEAVLRDLKNVSARICSITFDKEMKSRKMLPDS